jgi:hypothetical protein
VSSNNHYINFLLVRVIVNMEGLRGYESIDVRCLLVERIDYAKHWVFILLFEWGDGVIKAHNVLLGLHPREPQTTL